MTAPTTEGPCARCGHPQRVKIAGTNYRTHNGDVGPCALSVVKDPKSGSWGTRCDCPAYVAPKEGGGA